MDAKVYMQKVDNSGNLIDGTLKDLESDFSGLLYVECKGLLDKGKRKNVYIEEYADSDQVRVWQGESVTREPTNITLTLYFRGNSRQDTYDAFYEYVKNGIISYYDSVRLKEARLVLIDALEPKDDIFKGSDPFISASFKFQNLWGECKDKVIEES